MLCLTEARKKGKKHEKATDDAEARKLAAAKHVFSDIQLVTEAPR